MINSNAVPAAIGSRLSAGRAKADRSTLVAYLNADDWAAVRKSRPGIYNYTARGKRS